MGGATVLVVGTVPGRTFSRQRKLLNMPGKSFLFPEIRYAPLALDRHPYFQLEAIDSPQNSALTCACEEAPMPLTGVPRMGEKCAHTFFCVWPAPCHRASVRFTREVVILRTDVVTVRLSRGPVR